MKPEKQSPAVPFQRAVFWRTALVSLALTLAIEMLSRHSPLAGAWFMLSNPAVFCYNALLIFFTLSIGLFFRHRLFAQTLPSVVWLGLGAANCIVLFFRITPLEAIDFAILRTGIAISTIYMTVWQLVLIGVGAVHLIAGMAVKAVLLCKEGKPLDALFDIGSYWLLFAGLGVIFVQKKAGLIVLLCGVAAVVATQGRSKKGVMKFFGGLLGLYNLIDYASDLLSYSRILALGLAAGVIGQVVNILATLKGASFVGILMMILVFCLGHVLNLAINVLGTFVHTSRLQYIEFFGKFYEDGGTPFKPVTPSDRFADDVSGDGEEAAPVKELQEN